ncbi:MAG TPA: cyclic nucleotide-binding domain-containing protein [Actinomycetota bacterium]
MSMDVERLRALDLFADLDYHDLAQVAHWTRVVHAEPGEILFEQGDLPWDMLVIEEGAVEILHDGESLATLGPGDPVGEMSLLMQERRMATARATTSVEAIAIPADDLAKMEAEMPEVVAALRDVMEARRQRNADPGSAP